MMPWKKSCAGMVRVPPRTLFATISASSAAATSAPFGGRIGMRDAAAERAAGADGIVRDVTHDGGEQPPERPVHHRPVKGGVAHAGADGQPVAVDREPLAAPSTPLMSTRWPGRASRNAMIGTRLWPPASTRPSSPATSARVSTASSMVFGAW